MFRNIWKIIINRIVRNNEKCSWWGKKLVNEFNSRLDTDEVKISELKDKDIDIFIM